MISGKPGALTPDRLQHEPHEHIASLCTEARAVADIGHGGW